MSTAATTTPEAEQRQAQGPGAQASAQRGRPRWRGRVAWGVVVLLVAALTWLVTAHEASNRQALDPRNPGARGAEAVAEVLRQHGVEVTVVRSQDALLDQRIGPGTSVVMTRTEELSPTTARTALDHVRGADRVVLALPDNTVLDGLDLPVEARHTTSTGDLPAACSPGRGPLEPPLARDGERLSRGDVLYSVRPDAQGQVCFPPAGDAADRSDVLGPAGYLVTLPGVGAAGERVPPVVLVGSREVLQNATVTDADNAAVALRALGASPHLVWYVADYTDIAASDESAPVPLFPAWFAPALALVATAVAAAMVWRGRRLGPLVTEPLPVVVRAAEATESRGRLYRRAGDRGRAAAVLRAATRRHLTAYLGLPPAAPTPQVAVAAAAASGRPVEEVRHLLEGPDPQSDEALVQTAQGLASLEEEVRR